MSQYIKNKKKIDLIFEKGSTIKGNGLLLKAYNFEDGLVEFGVSVSKKLYPSAVKRNLIKRRIKEQINSLGLVGLMSKGISFFYDLYVTRNSILKRNKRTCCRLDAKARAIALSYLFLTYFSSH